MNASPFHPGFTFIIGAKASIYREIALAAGIDLFFDVPGGMEAFIESLGECQFLSPLRHRQVGADKFKTERHRILLDDSLEGVTGVDALKPAARSQESESRNQNSPVRDWLTFQRLLFARGMPVLWILTPGL